MLVDLLTKLARPRAENTGGLPAIRKDTMVSALLTNELRAAFRTTEEPARGSRGPQELAVAKLSRKEDDGQKKRPYLATVPGEENKAAPKAAQP